MQVREKAKVTIPPELAYGEEGYPDAIPPKTILICEVERLDAR
jgi:FKBP-type peptidyl-prolyl cis-trans isomerase